MVRFRVVAIVAILILSSLPVSGVESLPTKKEYLSEIPIVKQNQWNKMPWWETTTRDLNRNGVVDWLENIESEYPIGVLYDDAVTNEDIELLLDLGITIRYRADSVDGLLLGSVSSDLFNICLLYTSPSPRDRG